MPFWSGNGGAWLDADLRYCPEGLGGLTGGLFNFCANLAGILTPLVIGFIVAGFGNFFYALIYIGGAALLGVVAYLFILGDVKRIELSQ